MLFYKMLLDKTVFIICAPRGHWWLTFSIIINHWLNHWLKSLDTNSLELTNKFLKPWNKIMWLVKCEYYFNLQSNVPALHDSLIIPVSGFRSSASRCSRVWFYRHFTKIISIYYLKIFHWIFVIWAHSLKVPC